MNVALWIAPAALSIAPTSLRSCGRSGPGPAVRGGCPRETQRAQVIFANLVLIAIAVLVAWGRFGDYGL